MSVVNASQIAKYIIAEFQESEDPITNMKVQKLLYYVQGWHLGLYGTDAFTEELQAWVNGPVQYEVYQEYQSFSGAAITTKIERPQLPQNLIKHIQEVLECYGGENPYTLVSMTHKEWPWIEARDDLPEKVHSRNIISKKTMKEYFTDLAKSNEENHNYTLNQETIRVLEESKRGIGVQSISSIEEMFNEVYQELEEEGFAVERHVYPS